MIDWHVPAGTVHRRPITSRDSVTAHHIHEPSLPLECQAIPNTTHIFLYRLHNLLRALFRSGMSREELSRIMKR